MAVVPTDKRRSIKNIDHWTTLFQTFVAVYSEKYPHATPGLMKYMSIVRELASQSANWRFYDENFRMFREKYPVSWDQIHAESWLRAHSQRGLIANYGTDTGLEQPTRQIPARPPGGLLLSFPWGATVRGALQVQTRMLQMSKWLAPCLQLSPIRQKT